MSPAWSIQGQQAKLRANGCSAFVDLSRPDLGIQELLYAETSISPRLLGAFAVTDSDTRVELAEAYVRANDLVTRYETEDKLTRFSFYWRFGLADNSSSTLDLIASIHSEQLELHPAVETTSVYPDTDVSVWESRSATTRTPKRPIAVVAFSGKDFWGVEMQLDTKSSSPDVTKADRSITRRICEGYLEKGVIRKGVIRCQIARQPAESRDATIEDWLEHLERDGLPLTT